MLNNAYSHRWLLLPLAALVSTAAYAAPSNFTATATVQNAITIIQDTPMNFGTIFATRSSTGAVAADETYSEKLTLSHTGAISSTHRTDGDAPKVLAMSGNPTAASFTVDDLPANANVAINIFDAAGNAFTNSALADANCNYDTAALATAANKIVLDADGDPTNGIFCLDVFTSNRTNLLTTGYALGFSVTTLTFNLGATLVSQAPTTNGLVRTYAAGAYSGEYGLEVIFP
jgi:hypothetical protein